MNPFPLLCAALSLQGALVPPQHLPKTPASDKVVAKVNGAEIHAGEIEALLWDWRGQEVLQDIVSYKLICAEAERLKIQTAEVEVLKMVDDQIQEVKAGLPKDGDLEAELRRRGYPQSRLYMRVKSNLMLQRIAEQEFRPSEYVMVSTMVFEPQSKAEADVARAKTEAQAAATRLRNGEKWEVVLKSSHQPDTLAESLGALGWRRYDAFPDSTATALAKLKPGQVSDPVELPAGVQLFRVDALGSSAKDADLEDMRAIYMSTARAAILQRLHRDGKVELLGVKG
jgi:parvulin-like peptidyl-prolyl isomerase